MKKYYALKINSKTKEAKLTEIKEKEFESYSKHLKKIYENILLMEYIAIK